MSDRGAYGFILNGKRTVIYCRQGSGFYGLGTVMLHLLKKNSTEELTGKVASLEEVDADGIPTDDELQHNHELAGLTETMESIKGNTWRDVLEPFQYNPEGLLNTGKYISGEWSIQDSIEHLYLADIDKQSFEIWTYSWKASNDPEYNGSLIELISYSFDELPDNITYLEDAQWELNDTM